MVSYLAAQQYIKVKIKPDILSESLMQNAGESLSLPLEIMDLSKLVKKNHLENYALKGRLKKRALFYQRSIEFLYPVRYQPESNDIFVLEKDKLELDCPIVARKGRVVHYHCND